MSQEIQIIEEPKELIEDIFSDDGGVIDSFETATGNRPILEFIKRRIYEYNSNFNIVFVGEPGCGKSWSALRMALKIDLEFIKNPLIVFSAVDFVKHIKENKIKKGRVIFFDEVGVAVNKRMWWSTFNRVANLTFQTMRNRNFITIFTTPFTDYVDKDTIKLFQLYLKFAKAGRNYRIFKPYKLSYNEMAGKYFYHFLKFRVNGVTQTVTAILFNTPPKTLIKKYEKLKQEFQQELYSRVYKDIAKHEAKTTAEIPSANEWKNQVNELIKEIEPRLDDFIVSKKGIESIDVELLAAKTGKSKKICKAVATILERKYGIGKYTGDMLS